MKKYLFSFFLVFQLQAKADLFGGDLPLLAQIVFNTLHTMYELQQQSQLLKDEMAGINDRIQRVKTINDIVQPSEWDNWKDPKEALGRLDKIYKALPKEYKTEKSDLVESEIAKAMTLISNVSTDTKSTFISGKELEARALNSSPGVSAKLTASGVGTLISQQAQSQVIQSHVVSLLTQMLADGHEKESRMILTKAENYKTFSQSLSQKESSFSNTALKFGKSNE
jgi:hypothetical protein